MEIKTILALIEERKDELFDMLSKLIKLNSESYLCHGNEKNCAKYIHSLCQELGLESDMFSPLDLENFTNHPDYFPGRHLENRYNVVARWRGDDNTDELMLMAHEDTVEIGDVGNWIGDPLSGEIKDGKIWGRGSCDDKYAIATILFIIRLLKEQNFKPKRNLLFAAYADEEYGGSHGALAAVMKYPCNRIVNMDGRENQIWHCGSGGQEAKFVYHTANAVDSAAAAANAIPIVLEVMQTFADNRRSELEANEYYAGTNIPKTSLRYMDIHAGNKGMDLGIGEVRFVYYTDKTKDEIQEEFAALDSILTERLASLGLISDGFQPVTRFFHYVHCAPDSEDIQLMLEASREATGQQPIVCGSCLSDLSVISKYGNPRAFAFGAGRGFDKEGGNHQPNEYIECDKLVDFTKTIAAYVIKVLG